VTAWLSPACRASQGFALPFGAASFPSPLLAFNERQALTFGREHHPDKANITAIEKLSTTFFANLRRDVGAGC
jgi:hypothetical protein